MIANGMYITTNVSDHQYDLEAKVTLNLLKTCLRRITGIPLSFFLQRVFIFSTIIAIVSRFQEMPRKMNMTLGSKVKVKCS